MRKLFIRLVIFALPFLVFASYLEYRLAGVPTSYSQKRYYLESQKNEIEVLSLGSSHGMGINPAYFSVKGYNLSNVSQDIYYDVSLA